MQFSHIDAASVDQIISRVRLTKYCGTKTCFARMMAKAIMTKQRPKTQTRPTFCFGDILTLYINRRGMAMTTKCQHLSRICSLHNLLQRSVNTSTAVL